MPEDDEDEYSPFPWGELPWGPLIFIITVFLVGAAMEYFNWYPGH